MTPCADRLRIQISTLDPSSTVEQFIAKCELPSWDAGASTTGFSSYTWWLENGYGLHACFADGPYIITNRFGPCGISHAGELVWKLSQTEDKWNTICGTLVRDLAAETHPESKNAG